jgi:excisionase family DNA binding protein
MISQSLQNQVGRSAVPAAPATGAAPASPDVMTPAEAAAVLRVSEEDVMAAITAGDLKARKIGNAFRISKDALDAFLKGS